MSKQVLCNVQQSHKRILEAHRLWHQAKHYYFDPEGFRTNINAAIQALRNITFAIQNEKRTIPDFNIWYDLWVTKLKEDKIMRWLCDARLNIVHKKDLEMNSIAKVTILNYDTVLVTNIDVPISYCGIKLLNYLYDLEVLNDSHKKADLYATIERKWIINDFPDFDVLYLISYGIGTLYRMVEEAHQKVNSSINTCSVKDTMHALVIEKDNVPLCMKNYAESMNEKIGLKDYISRKTIIKEIIPKNNINIEKRYKKILNSPNINNLYDPFAFAKNLLEICKKVLVKDGYHVNILYYLTSKQKWNIVEVSFEDQTSKFMFWQEFSKKVKKENIIAIIFIGEIWLGLLDLVEKGVNPSEQPDKKQALSLSVFTNEIKSKTYITEFTKNMFGKVKLGDTVEFEDNHELGYIKPIINVWKDNILKQQE